VLWHEFCHVVTLEKTKNRMPRWLSEGISVYEERQRDPAWGEAMTPIYREMLLAEDLTPASDLSAAFLSPPSPIHLQFAYYESSLVVEFLVEQYGLDAVKRILDDLGNGLAINDALIRSVGSLQKLDGQFADYARKQAEGFGSEADWSREEMPEDPSPEELVAWVDRHPTSYWGLRRLGEAYVAAGQFEKAKTTLQQLQSLKTATGERGDPLELLSRVYHQLGDAVAEREALQEIISLSSDALPALRRLIEMAREEQEWEEILEYAQEITSINPLLPEGHLAMAEAAEMLDRPREVLRSLSAISQMDPVDPAGIDYRIASSYAELNQLDRAKHHVLRALEEAPRFRDAHRLLLELSERAIVQQDTNEKTDERKVE
jgi:tetratricopeptide (TPR) repeat protein